MSGCYAGSRQEAEFHKTMSEFGGKIETVEHSVLSMGEIQDRWMGRGVPPLSLLETQLHNTFRIGHQKAGVKAPGNARNCYT
jgi:hypothetical protein